MEDVDDALKLLADIFIRKNKKTQNVAPLHRKQNKTKL